MSALCQIKFPWFSVLRGGGRGGGRLAGAATLYSLDGISTEDLLILTKAFDVCGDMSEGKRLGLRYCQYREKRTPGSG